MANDSKTEKAVEITPEQRKAAIAAYHNAKTREEKAALVKANPFLAEIFSALNHS